MSAPSVSLRVKRQGSATAPVIYARWRDPADPRRQVERRIGRGWLVRKGEPGGRPNGATIGDWRVRSGRPPEGHLTPDAARERVPEVVDAWEREADEARQAARRERDRLVTFGDSAREWLRRRERKGCKASTLRDYRNVLAEPPEGGRTRNGTRATTASGRVMHAFGDRPVADVTPADVRDFLDDMEADELSPRTINKVRQVLWSVFEVAREPAERGRDGLRAGGGFGAIEENPVRADSKRREGRRRELQVYSPEEVEALVRAAASGAHRSERARGMRDRVERAQEDRTDAALFLTAAYAGLRLGELRALRWRHVDFDASAISVYDNYVAGVTDGPKSGKPRTVPMSEQVARALADLRLRSRFGGDGDLVFASRLGGVLDDSALRRRYERARVAAGQRRLTIHELRHTFGSLCAASGIDVVRVQRMMGHASITTTMRYFHAVAAGDEAELLTRAFGGTAAELQPAGA